MFALNSAEVSAVGHGDISGQSGTIATDNPFNLLAIHFGQHGLVFGFFNPITQFEINVSANAAGLSNYRAY